MKKIITLIAVVFCLISKAQVTSISYPSGYLSEEKITQIIKTAKKNGTKDPELQRHKEHLHQLLVKQNQAIANGTYGKRTILPPPVATAGCTNPGFETGNTSGWTMYQGTVSGATLPCPTCFTDTGGVYQITSAGANGAVNTYSTNNVGGDASATCDCTNAFANDCTPEPFMSGIDRFGGFPVVAPAPLGGSYSLMLNNSNCGYLIQRASQTINVSAANNSFTFQYAAVLQDGGHPLSEAPYFMVTVKNSATGASVPCLTYSASAEGATSGNLVGWTASTIDHEVYYSPWTTVSLDLTAFIGIAVTISFDVSDCSQGGHFGYVYIDASCNSTQITESNPLCTGGTTILSGPPGMATYTWTGPVTGNTQNLVTGTPGNYTLTTSSSTSCPAPVLYYTLTSSSSVSPTVSVVATNDSICSGATTTLTASGANTYTWSNSATTSSITISPINNITYTVTGTDTTSGCANSATQIIHVNTIVSIQTTQDTVCIGAPVILTASGADTYTWSANAGSAVSNTVSVSPTTNTTYSVVGINTVSSCTNSATQLIHIKSCTTGIDQFANNHQITVYPNPANNMLYISCKLKNSMLFVTDILGNRIKQTNIESELTSVDISGLSEGVYFINIQTANGTITKKIIVQR